MEIREPIEFKYDANIVANSENWKLVLTLEGPNNRYNDTRVTVYSKEVVYFASHLSEALEKYLAIRPMVKNDAEIEDSCGHVTINVGGHFDGVCVGGYRVLLETREELNKCLLILNAVPDRGEELVAGIRKVEALTSSRTLPQHG